MPGRASRTARRGSSRRCAREVEQRRLGPVDVLDDDHERPFAREVLEEPADRPEHLLLGRSLGRQADRRGDPRREQRRPSALAVEQRARSWRAPRRRVSVSSMPGAPADDLADRPVGDPLAVGQAAAAQDRGLVGEPRENSATRRLLPTPAVPSSVNSWHDRSEAARRRRCRERPSSRSRPTSGVSSRRAWPATPGRTATRRYAATGPALPLATIGSTGSTSTASRTSCYVGWPRKFSPGGAAASRRAAVLIVSPVANRAHLSRILRQLQTD